MHAINRHTQVDTYLRSHDCTNRRVKSQCAKNRKSVISRNLYQKEEKEVTWFAEQPLRFLFKIEKQRREIIAKR